jgi:hypothetical protein
MMVIGFFPTSSAVLSLLTVCDPSAKGTRVRHPRNAT